jgi:HSP20 family protein
MMTRWNDLDQMLGSMDFFRNRMNSVFDAFNRAYHYGEGWPSGETFPGTNLSDTGDNLEIIAEMPGVGKEDLSVKIEGNYLVISGKRQADIPKGYSVHRIEREVTSFSRSFTLPYEVDTNRVEATLKDGLLRMVLPKSEAAKPKQISIN